MVGTAWVPPVDLDAQVACPEEAEEPEFRTRRRAAEKEPWQSALALEIVVVVSDSLGNTLGLNGDCVYIIIYIYAYYILYIYIYLFIVFYFLMMISIAVIVSIVIIWSLVTPRTRAENRLQQVARPRPWRVVVFLCSIFCHTLFAISRV